MYIEPFKVEIWMNEWETRCTHNLAETCVASITVEELLSLCGQREQDLSELLLMKLTYGEIEGSRRLRSAIAALYTCLLYTSPSPRDRQKTRMPSSA